MLLQRLLQSPLNVLYQGVAGEIELSEFKRLLRSDAKISKAMLSDKDIKMVFAAVPEQQDRGAAEDRRFKSRAPKSPHAMLRKVDGSGVANAFNSSSDSRPIWDADANRLPPWSHARPGLKTRWKSV